MEVKRRERVALLRCEPPRATAANRRWSIDFVHDQMQDGRAFRICHRDRSAESQECVPAGQLPPSGRCVSKVLGAAAGTRWFLRAITVDNGTKRSPLRR